MIAAGIVLCGGQSQRMGRPKAWVPFAGEIMLPRVGHPLAAVYRLDVADAVNRLLAENRLRPFFLFEAVSTRVVEAAELADVDPTFQTLRNLNTPEDYEAALREI